MKTPRRLLTVGTTFGFMVLAPLPSPAVTKPVPNILLIIIDDWGTDASSLYHKDKKEGRVLAKMRNIEELANSGLLFTNAHAQPTCSPTRAAILTGRQAFQTRVGNPKDVLPEDEHTLPEAFQSEASRYALGSFGKWHLGNLPDRENIGYSDLGGWPVFKGFDSGAVNPNYYSWVKNDNGKVKSPYKIYSTSDQVNDAIKFIKDNALRKPWFCWVAFNAPHTPYHDPPPGLAPIDGYSPQPTDKSDTSQQSWQYRKMLEALDTEIGRLLKVVNRNKTYIIVIGDNGTQADVVQAPFGPVDVSIRERHAKGDLYQGGIHVPLIVSGPAVTKPGSTTDALVHATDLFETILELSGINLRRIAVTTSTDGDTNTGETPRDTPFEVKEVEPDRGPDDPDLDTPAGDLTLPQPFRVRLSQLLKTRKAMLKIDATPNSKSIVPILNGTDSGERYMIVEKIDETPGEKIEKGDSGRAIRISDYPNYKLIRFGGLDSELAAEFEFYNLADDENEDEPLVVDKLNPKSTAYKAYWALRIKEASIGGNYGALK